MARRCRVGIAPIAILLVALLGGCGGSARSGAENSLPSQLVREARPIGRGPHFHLPARGPVVGRCLPRLGRRIGVHVELFAGNKVVLVPPGIGTKPPRQYSAGRISRARCYGDVVTLEPTGVVLVRADARLRLSDLFRAWGQPLSSRSMASFTARGQGRVRAFVDGRGAVGAPGRIPLAAHAEIVLEVGPYVPPHSRYLFPPGA